jgi:hypothetical protein
MVLLATGAALLLATGAALLLSSFESGVQTVGV